MQPGFYNPVMFKIDQPPLPAGSPLSAARNEMWLPRAGLAAAVRAVVARDSRGIALPAAQRYTYFPASPLCSITWFLARRLPLRARQPAAGRR